MNFLSNFFSNSIFREQFFWRRKLSFENRVYFFPDKCSVDENLFRRFLKYIENSVIFEFFPVFITKRVASPFFNPRAGNPCRAIYLFFLFQSPSPLKMKCGFLMRFLKKIAQYVPRIMRLFFRFTMFAGSAASHSISFSVLLRECRK